MGRGDLRSALHQSAPISWKETVLKRKDGRDEEDDDGDTVPLIRFLCRLSDTGGFMAFNVLSLCARE